MTRPSAITTSPAPAPAPAPAVEFVLDLRRCVRCRLTCNFWRNAGDFKNKGRGLELDLELDLDWDWDWGPIGTTWSGFGVETSGSGKGVFTGDSSEKSSP